MAKTQPPLSQALRQAVLDSGQPLSEVARRTGLDLGNLSRFVRGQRWLSEANLDTLAEYLGLVLVRPGGGGKIKRTARMLVLAAAVAAAQADPSPANDALAALLGVGLDQSEARAMLEKATASGREFTSAAALLGEIFRPA